MLKIILLIVLSVDALVLGFALLFKGKMPLFNYELNRHWGWALILTATALGAAAVNKIGLL